VIEAHYLYGVDYDNIEIVIHPQSIIHSMVETADSSVLAQVRAGCQAGAWENSVDVEQGCVRHSFCTICTCPCGIACIGGDS
jgi:hypothetical protein